MAGLRTARLSWQQSNKTSIELTHGDDVCFSVVHPNVVLLCPAQADFRPGFEHMVLIAESFPLCHQHLETGDGT